MGIRFRASQARAGTVFVISRKCTANNANALLPSSLCVVSNSRLTRTVQPATRVVAYLVEGMKGGRTEFVSAAERAMTARAIQRQAIKTLRAGARTPLSARTRDVA